MSMIKVQDFAKQKGVTDKAIYKHLNRHKSALEGHFERKGKNGTWLDDFACSFISEKMIQNPVVVADSEMRKEIEELRAQNQDLYQKLINAQDLIITMKDEISQAQLTLAETQNEKKTLELKLEMQTVMLENEKKLREEEKKRGFFARLFGK